MRRGAGVRWPAREDLPLAAVLGAELLVTLLLPRVVTVDGPAHVDGAWVLAHHGRPLLARLYEVDLTPVPNMLSTFVLGALLRVTGPDLAEEVLVCGHLLLLPLALRYALRAVDPRAGWLALLGVPFSTGYLFLYGFYNFVLAVGLALLVVGLALRRRAGWSPGSGLLLAVLLLVTWTAHLMPVLAAGGTVAALAVARTLAVPGPRAAAARRHLLPVVLAGLPVLALTVWFSLTPAADKGAPGRVPWYELVWGLLSLRKPLVSWSGWEQLPALALAAVVGWLVLRARRRPLEEPLLAADRRALLVATAGATVAYLASPEHYGSEYGFLNDRLSLFPPLLLLLWAAGPPPGPVPRRRAVAVVLTATAAFALLRVPHELGYQRDVAELLSVQDAVPPGSTLLKVQLWRDPPGARNHFRDALRHAVSRLAAETDGVDVGHYEADLPYFPVRFRPSTSPRRAVDPTGRGLWATPPAVRLDTPVALAAVDVVVVVGRERARPVALERGRALLGDLGAHYRRVAVSRRTGLVEVWVRR